MECEVVGSNPPHKPCPKPNRRIETFSEPWPLPLPLPRPLTLILTPNLCPCSKEKGLFLPAVHKHPLFYESDVTNHQCDLCSCRIKSGAWRCKLCDYDICAKCVARKDSTRTLSLSLTQRPHPLQPKLKPKPKPKLDLPDGLRANTASHC